jgi:hypothetical protein
MILKNILFRLIHLEYRQTSRDKALWMLIFGGIILYALMYNFMYMPQTVRGVPVAVVDDDCSPASRTFLRRLSATPQVQAVTAFGSLPQARQAMEDGRVQGVVHLPRNYGSRLGQGRPPIYIMWGNTASLLTYAAVQEAVSAVSLAQRAELAEQAQRAQAAQSPSPTLQAVGLAVGNSTAGYGTYLVPAVLMVILFQTLCMAILMRYGTDAERRYRPLRAVAGRVEAVSLPLVASRFVVWMGIYGVMALFVCLPVTALFGLPMEGSPGALAALMGAYLSASVAFALALGSVATDREGGLVYVAFFSAGYLFLSGISYPVQSLPVAWQVVRTLFPVCPAVQAYVEIRSLGATLGDIFSQVALLLIQAKVYISVAVWAQKWRLKRQIQYEILKKAD